MDRPRSNSPRMLLLQTLLLLLPLSFLAPASAAVSSSNATATTTTAAPSGPVLKACYQCGVELACPFPFNPSGVATVNCSISCYKFDGYATDGSRVIMRDCGYFTTNECAGNQDLFNGDSAVGKVCHCTGKSLCNGAGRLAAALAFWTVVAVMLFVMLKNL